MTIRDRDGRRIDPPRRTFERAEQLEQIEQELAEAQQRIAEMEAQLRRLRGG